MTLARPRTRFASAALRFGYLRSLGLLAAALGLAGCVSTPRHANHYPAKSDVKPHPRVAKAHHHPIHGIDVSKWQGRIDWTAVRAANTKFAFIKATEGADHLDERFHENWTGAKRAGVARGAYHFVYWCRPASQQMAWFKRNVPSDPDALPPVLDVEWNGHSRTCPKRVPREIALAQVKQMLREMEDHTGKRPIIYTDINFHRDVLAGELEEYPHWLRSVAAEPHERYANRRWAIWQYTSTGRVPGVQGDVDRNAFYGSSLDWAKFAQTGCDPRSGCTTMIAAKEGARLAEEKTSPRTHLAEAQPLE